MRFVQSGALVSIIVLAACSGGKPAADENAAQSGQSAQVANAANGNATEAVGTEAGNSAAASSPETVGKSERAEEAKQPEKTGAAPAKEAEATAPVATPPAPEPAKALAEPPKSFARCAVCHTVNKGGEDKLGPNLFGIVGAKAGHHRPGFHYSDALKNSGLTWNEATLDQWIAKPMKMVPGTIMAFPGISDPAKRQELIDYLKAQK